jgi:UDP-N-acetylglucosamine 4,6-dehydratase
MITEDDARTTLEMQDRYIVEPAFGPEWLRAGHDGNGFDRVPETFRYGSDTNPETLSVEQIRALLAATSSTAPLEPAGTRPAMH